MTDSYSETEQYKLIFNRELIAIVASGRGLSVVLLPFVFLLLYQFDDGYFGHGHTVALRCRSFLIYELVLLLFLLPVARWDIPFIIPGPFGRSR